jgi:hypothetical protein
VLGWVFLLATAAWAAARVFAGYPRVAGYGVLAAREVAGLDAAAEALFPPGGAIACSGADAQVARYIDRLVAASHPRTRLLMRMLFFLIEHGTLIFPAPGGVRGRRRFSSLALDERVEVLEGWQTSRLFPRRLVFTSLRALFTLGYFAHPPVLCALGLAPAAIESPICKADLLYPRIGAHPDTIPWRPEDLTPPSDGTPLALDGPRMPGYEATR